MLRCYVFSVLFYGVESWTLNEDICRKLEAVEMWLYRRMLKIPYSSLDILCEMNSDMLSFKTSCKEKYLENEVQEEEENILVKEPQNLVQYNICAVFLRCCR
ncbi:unnamed protein product [Diabrotica balteata]|uniref:Uncharacterized protein n=1 Tax=Diabrotica balteata TaxID=107213 RepID=A0A9N9T4L0_DIABA|nr:unnamed protein product [Diabrotica balteata]